MAGEHLAGHDLQGGKQRTCPVTFVLMADASQGRSIRQSEVALCALQRLNVRLLIDAEHQRILRWMEIECDHVGGLRPELRIRADAPTSLALQLDFLGS